MPIGIGGENKSGEESDIECGIVQSIIVRLISCFSSAPVQQVRQLIDWLIGIVKEQLGIQCRPLEPTASTALGDTGLSHRDSSW